MKATRSVVGVWIAMCVEIEPTKPVKQYADDEDQCRAREARK